MLELKLGTATLWGAGVVIVLGLLVGCGSPSSDAGPAQQDGAPDALDCDVRGGADASSVADSGSAGFEGGVIDLDAGNVGMPPGRLKCFDPETGAGFDCSSFGGACCEKKDECYQPASEPTFCDRAYCE